MLVRGSVCCCLYLALSLAGRVHAEALPGSVEVSAGAELLVLADRVCDHDGDVVDCNSFEPFAGFVLAGRKQLVDWFALGARLAGTTDLDATESVSSDGYRTDRDLWLWRFSLEARFSPALFPRGSWLAAETGAALLSDSVDDYDGAGTRVSGASRGHAGFLLGAALGWDFPLHQGVLFGVAVRGQWIAFGQLRPPRANTGRLDLPDLPYVALDLHVGYRW